MNWDSYLYRLASVFQDGEVQAVADRLFRESKGFDDPAMFYLWYDPAVKAGRAEELAPHHYFADHEVVCWRSSWDPNATVFMFKCGPPEGHAAAAKARLLKDWYMNHGHVHPDIGMFWLYAKGQYLAVDTGYTQRKRTRDHNTILVEGCGQGIDYNYWVYRGLPYDKFDPVKIEKVYLAKDYGYAMGDFGSAYHPPEKVGKLSLKRHVLITGKFLVVFDEMGSDRANTYTWLLHSDGPFAEKKGCLETIRNDARLAVYSLAPKEVKHEIGPTVVFRGKEPHEGKDEEVGHQLTLETPQKVMSNQFLTVLVPLGKDEPAPTKVDLVNLGRDRLELKITWPGGAEQNVSLDLSWKPGSTAGPATIGAAREPRGVPR